MIKKTTAFMLAAITALLGIFIGMNIKKDFNSDLLLCAIIIFNSLLIISSINNKK